MGEKKREFLFKGKRRDGNGWAEGYLMDENHICIMLEGNEKRIVEIDPETVCQHTGRRNAEGRVYEWDIFQTPNVDGMYMVVWDEYYLEWSAQRIGDLDETYALFEFEGPEISVIGNIFDNPELAAAAGEEEAGSREEERSGGEGGDPGADEHRGLPDMGVSDGRAGH